MGGKKEKSSSGGSLGRALVRQHNQMIREAKDKGAALRKQQRKGVLESVTELTDIEVILEQAEEADRVFSVSDPTPGLRIDLDGGSCASGFATDDEKRKLQKQEEALFASSLRVPRRPPWTASMTVEELDANERQAFLAWRRSLARLEENDKLVLTPFEKNLDVWRQLWRVLERSDLLVMVVDARDPLFYRCPDLEAYAREIGEHRRTLLLVNKADLLPIPVRRKWAEYFHRNDILFVFWSAKAASASLDGKRLENYWGEQNHSPEFLHSDADTKIYSRDELLARLQSEAESIVLKSNSNQKSKKAGSCSSDSSGRVPAVKQVVAGFVGYPNVGKSSTINALVGEKRTGVTSTPGKTKHFQTLIISDKLMLCDCPGLVFPSFSSSRYEMIASGVLPIDRMTAHREAVQVVANRVSRKMLEDIYNITLPKPKAYESQSRPPLASELLRAYCSSRGYVASSGLPDETRAARLILKDFLDGKLPHFELPPGDTVEDRRLSLQDGLTGYASDSRESDDETGSSGEDEDGYTAGKPDMNSLLNDLESFDMASGMAAAATAKKKKVTASHKHHKKIQRKKDRSWRVGNDGGDGMPVVRMFQKPAVNLGSVKSDA